LALSLVLLVISMLIPDRVSNRKMAQRRNVMMGESLMPREKEVVA
jgi:hypothetical protein